MDSSPAPTFVPIPVDFDQYLGNFEYNNEPNTATYSPYIGHDSLGDWYLRTFDPELAVQGSTREHLDSQTIYASTYDVIIRHAVDGRDGITQSMPTIFLESSFGQSHLSFGQPEISNVISASPPPFVMVLSNSQTLPPWQTPKASQQPKTPPRNSQGQLICTYIPAVTVMKRSGDARTGSESIFPVRKQVSS
jgi:hypothetical protein